MELNRIGFISLPQDKGDESDPIKFQKYLANMTAKIGKYSGDQLFHAISRDKNQTTVHFMYSTYYKVEVTQSLQGIPCILSEEILINYNNLITRSGIE